MELKESERTVIAKPVPSRPTTSTNFRPFSKLLAGAINVAPSSEAAMTAIRPKTVRFKPLGSTPPVDQAEALVTKACYSSDKVLESTSKSTVVYKPLAKDISNVSHRQALAQVEACAQTSNQVNHHLTYDLRSDVYQKFPSQLETDNTIGSSKIASENLENDRKSQPHTSTMDRPSYDGYNWRKYGQKQVKGSEYPRSYYKCTHPTCPVKKKVERSSHGEIAEIVYKGEHNHLKPQLSTHNTSVGQEKGLSNNTLDGGDEGFDGPIENQNEVFGSSSNLTNLVKTPGSYSASVVTPDNSCDDSGDCEERTKVRKAAAHEPKSRRRKKLNQSNEAVVSGDSVQETRFVVQNPTDSETTGDGFRWRKYGQKVVKGNPYPRSYYRCTGLKCNVRKHVERASDDPSTFITTYEGKHNHEMPIKLTNSVASEPADSNTTTSKDRS